MLSRKLALLLVLGVVQVEARNAGTVIAQFRLINQVLPSGAKWFTNNTKDRIQFRWKVIDRETGLFCAQEPIMAPKTSVEIQFDQMADYFDLQAGPQWGSMGYDVTIEVSKVLSSPQQKWDEIDAWPFKNGRKNLLISSATFLENNDFELLLRKPGTIDCKPLFPRKVLRRKQR